MSDLADAPWQEATRRAREAYGRRAEEYVAAVGTMESTAPEDRALVERWAAGTPGPLLDLGCGPGQWTAHLVTRGHDVTGMDPTPQFLALARRAHPQVRFVDGGLEDLAPRARWGGILAWYSLIHLDPADMPAALARLHRALRPGGTLLLGFFADDDGERARTERAAARGVRVAALPLGAPIAPEPFPHGVTTAQRWPPEAMAALLQEAGFRVAHQERRTDPGVRPQAAILARRGG